MRRTSLLFRPSILHFDTSISMTFYLLAIIHSIHMSIRCIQMNWKSEIPQNVLCLLRIRMYYWVWTLTTKWQFTFYDKRDYFNFSIVNFPYPCSNSHASPAYGLYILQLIRYASACSTYHLFLVRDSLLTNEFMSQGFQLSRLQAAFSNLYGRCNNLICPNSLSLGHMMSAMFYTNRRTVLGTLILTTDRTVYLFCK
jgi:hypothetical protein